ncbi:MAG: response regulator transcription factor [Chloroflexi bacterium]|nr:response regulator transcription factor [Chloroflexota bacterium]
MNAESKMTPSILIADDHNIMRKTLRQWLATKFPNLRVIEANSGEQALERLRDNEFHLVLMDIHLPGINGITTTTRIKNEFPNLPVIVLTVQEDERYQFEATQAGADAYVIKRKMYADLVPLMLSFLGGETLLQSAAGARK